MIQDESMNEVIMSAEDAEPPGSASLVFESVVKFNSFPIVPLNPVPLKPVRRIPRLTISARSHAFRKRFYPQASVREWNDWRWQNSNRIRTVTDLARIIRLSQDEASAIKQHQGPLPMGIGPYYAGLLDEHDPNQPLRRTVVPVSAEYIRSLGEADDPLGEDDDSPVPGIVHRYPDRVLLLATGICSTYCRYCTRSRLVGASGERSVKKSHLEQAITYIETTPAVRDVLISGGDPLSLDDDKLNWLLGRLRRIPHIEFLRIGTKMPAVLPQRITPALARILKRYRPWLSIHFAHPDELTPEVTEACGRLANAGIPLGSQTVLLKGVNDEVDTLRRLFQGLLRIRVKPYYLYQCDPISGSAHFRTPVEKGLEMIRGLRGHTTGYAVPTYVIDAPGGGGKIPLLPEAIIGRDGDDLLLKNFVGEVSRYPDPSGRLGLDKELLCE
jgi:lysine 2,3-aminomutase